MHLHDFILSAPGRVFLYGDHAMRHRKNCVAVSLEMRTWLSFEAISQGTSLIDYYLKIQFCSINLGIRIRLFPFYERFLGNDSARTFSSKLLYEEVKDYVSNELPTRCIGAYEPGKREHRLSLEAFFYLFLSIVYDKNVEIRSSIIVDVTTDLPIGEGLGSSASLAVCLAASFWRWFRVQREEIDKNQKFDEGDLKEIQRYAQSCESLVYKSSYAEIDTVVSVYGSMTIFKINCDGKLEWETFRGLPSMKMLLVSSNVSSREARDYQIARMETLRHLYRSVDDVLDSIDAVSTMSIKALRDILTATRDLSDVDFSNQSRQLLLHSSNKLISNLINMSQGLIRGLGMLHPSLDLICAYAQSCSFAASNGGGGYACIFLLPDSKNDDINQVLSKLYSQNFEPTTIQFCCNGINVLDII